MTILSETTIKVLNPIGIVSLFISLLIIVLLIIISISIIEYINGTIIITIFFVIVMYFSVAMTMGSTPHRRIKAIISDDYPATNLYDEYTVEDRDGKIWILTEKEPMTEEDEE